jgi:CHAD domain-containing protein
MAKDGQSVYPIQSLRDATTALEASILLCLAKPGKKAVHELRTAIRRVEAQFALLPMLPQLPQHKRQRQKALRLLKKLRRAAGLVRDLDVQRQLIRDEAAASHGAIRHEARQLRRELKRKRDDQATHLLKVLHKQTANLRPVFEKLLHTLAPAESLALSERQLTGLAHNLYAHLISGPALAAHNDTAQLHALRKRAKLARYLAESAPPSAAASHRLAAHFEKLQEAGGKWHDWLLLTSIAAGDLGHSASLAERFAARTQSSLRTFKRRLNPPLPRA